MFWSLTASAQSQTGGGFKPQVINQPRQDPILSDGPLLGAPPPVLPADPIPVTPQQPPPGTQTKPPEYGNKNFSDKINDMINRFRGDKGEYYNGGAGSNGEYFGPGEMQKCDKAPASAEKAYEEAKNFRASCRLAQRGDQQKIAVNDYSTRPAYMYIFDQAGKCLGKTMVAFGNGAGGAQIACSDSGSHLSPPGFHLTAIHHGGGKYNPNNSIKMVGLQGQNSVGRGILIHEAGAPGTSSTWGCAGVGYGAAFKAVKETLGYGALVYNYWSPQQMANNCKNRAGMTNNGTCVADAGTPGIPDNATGQGAPAVTRFWWKLIDEAYAIGFPGPRLKIKKGTEIAVLRLLVRSGTLEIEMVKEEAQGPNVVRPEELIRALGLREPVKDFLKRIERESGGIYVLKNDLPLLWEAEIYRLQKRKN
jgi:hypothetical protein